jgi:polyribonucleotide nucleotidyltransferase
MNGTKSVTANVGGKDITIETGLLAHLASGAVTVRLGDTILFSAVTRSNEPIEGKDYFPLSVEYREKYYAAGRFPGGFVKRETRPSEKETLAARLTDRPLRPLFPNGYRNEVQVNNMLLSADGQNDSDILSIVAASAALTLSDIPFNGPVAGVRVARVDGQFVVNPTHEQREKSDLDLVYACTRTLPLMLEARAKEITEADFLAAMKAAHPECQKLIEAQLELRRLAGLPDKVYQELELDKTFLNAAREIAGAELSEALVTPDKQGRGQRVDAIRKTLKEKLTVRFPAMTAEQFRSAMDELEIETVRMNVLEKGRRVDGRGFDEVRPLSGQVGVLPRTHGSALFSRGQTQSLGTVTLGTKSDSQKLDAITGGLEEKTFMLHYNFPPYSTGECGRIGTTGRREIGHGNLAERSLAPVIPADYPYTIRLVSDIMTSNGSTSMASVCVGTLALMDAGVPITNPVAGISVGLFSNEKKTNMVVDILGTEDHCGDMDFKVAGTKNGITGVQVDLKVPGLRWEIVEGALQKAHQARLQILEYMKSVIAEPRPELSQHAPRIHQLKIPVDKIGELIGPGGKNIRRITDLSGAQIDIEDDGTVSIFAVEAESMKMALREIEGISAEPEIGKTYEGTVTGIKEFGAFVEILPGRDGLVHISELADYRVNNVEEVCKVGDPMTVKLIGVDDRGRIKLSRREYLREKDGLPPSTPPPAADGDRGGSPDDRQDRRPRDDRGGDRRGGDRRGGDRRDRR